MYANTTKSCNIAVIFNPRAPNYYSELHDVVSALEYLGNTVLPKKADKSLFLSLKEQPIDLVFNLARRISHTQYSVSVSAICELFGLNIIGPNVFTASLCNDKKILSQILKYDGLPFKEVIPKKDFMLLDVFLLGTIEPLFFFKKPIELEMTSVITQKIIRICQNAFLSIHGTDYCNFTFVLHKQKYESPFLININPMPHLGIRGTFAKVISLKKIKYIDFINRIVFNALKHLNLPRSDASLTFDSSIKDRGTFVTKKTFS